MDLSKKVKDIMSTEIISVDENTLIDDFKPYFSRRNIHHVLVTDKDDELSGIISSIDVSRSSNISVESQLRAKHFMTGMPLSVNQNAALDFVLDVFLDNLYRALPVINDSGSLVGIVTPYDLLMEIRKSR